MCTVSLFPLLEQDSGFILTSNRDEAIGRETNPPELFRENGCVMLYPKDVLAGGTWIGVSDRKRTVCLMNGGFQSHTRQSNYRLSRGVVVKDLLAAEDIQDKIHQYNFEGIEPFTVIIVDWSKRLTFLELVWDGDKAHFKDLPIKDYIWSSSSLYNECMKSQRETWFENLKMKEGLTQVSILEFHHNAGIGDKAVDLVMDRGFLKTRSITQVIFKNGQIEFLYEDLLSGRVTSKNMELNK